MLENKAIKTIHCIGIGGIGVSGIAEILLKKGYRVTGSDVKPSAVTNRLVELGATISYSHKQQHVSKADAVIYSSAINLENPELKYACDRDIPVVKRGKMLAELMQDAEGIAISGTHGKTTATSLTAFLLQAANLDPTYVIGGIINGQLSPVRVGKGRYFVAEADESDASFLYLSPKIIVVNNIEPDHLENYNGDFDCLKLSFVDFLNHLPEDGVAILGIDDPMVAELVPHVSCQVVTYGFAKEADFRAIDYKPQGVISTFTLCKNMNVQQEITLTLPGKHNVVNAMAAIVVATLLNIPEQTIKTALAQFPGVNRRFHAHGEIAVKDGKALLLEDYGHHPSAIAMTLQAARGAWPDKRIVLVFQPHRYTRTRDLMQEFVQVLCTADQLLLLEVYSAGEAEIPEASSQALLKAIAQATKTPPVFVPKIEALTDVLQNILQPNDVVIFQGAGNIGALAHELIEASCGAH